jgi:glutaminase
MPGDTAEERIGTMLNLFSDLAGRRLEIDEQVFRSENATGHRNRAIAYMMLNSGMIERDPIEALDLYFRQCSITVSCRDLAMMAATLANDGINTLTGVSVFDPHYVRDVLSVMNSCGMYNYAGQWSYEVGMPAKSGVSGCIMAVIPGQVGIGVYSPPLDAQGNSVRGIKVCQDISNEFELHAFNNRTNVRSVIRRVYRGDRVRSSRLRTAHERELLDVEGAKSAVIEVQGALYFGTTEQLLRRIAELSETARYIIVDFKRVHLADSSACKLILRLAHSMRAGQTELLFAEIANEGPLAGISRELAKHKTERLLRVFRDVDAALEWCEDQLLSNMLHQNAEPKFAPRARCVQRPQCRGIPAGGDHREPAHFREGRGHHPRGRPREAVLRLGAGQRERADQDSTQTGEKRRRVASIGSGLIRRDGAVRRRCPLGRRRRRREGHLLWGSRSSSPRAAGVHPNITMTIPPI